MRTRPLTILVVDDIVDSADSMALLLRLYGYEVYVAHSCTDALAVVTVHIPDVVLMDLGLPDLDGYETAKRIGAKLTKPPLFVAVTGYGQETYHDRSRQEGFDRHFVKPVDLAELADYLALCERTLA